MGVVEAVVVEAAGTVGIPGVQVAEVVKVAIAVGTAVRAAAMGLAVAAQVAVRMEASCSVRPRCTR